MSRRKTTAVRTGTTPKRCPIRGVFFHKASGQYISYVGYHEKTVKDKRGREETRRVRSTQYLGSDETKAIAKYFQVKAEWKDVVAADRKRFEDRKAWLREQGLSVGKDRFKPMWPTAHGGTAAAVKPWSQTVEQVVDDLEASKRNEPMKLTVLEGRDKYLADYKARIGLLNGQGINENTYIHCASNLNLALALNPEYKRDRKPIDTSKTFEELTLEDYKAFVRFWCDPTIVKSDRTGFNYIRAFKQMVFGLKIKLPEGAEEQLNLRVKFATKIVRYNAAHLKALLNCPNEKARMYMLMALNMGYYQVDIARLKFEHITDAEGNPYRSGDMFITKRRERTLHQNTFTTTCYVWPETQALMEKYRARPNPANAYFLSKLGTPYDVDTISPMTLEAIKAAGLHGQFTFKQFRKIGASQIKALADSDAMHMYKANAASAADKPYVVDDFSRLTAALKKFREKLKADGVL